MPAALQDLRQFVEIVLLAVAALLPIVNPLGGAPIFLAKTADVGAQERSAMAKSVAVNGFILLIASTLVGAFVLDFFGLSIPAVRVAGGVVVCAIAWSLLNEPDVSVEPTRDAAVARVNPDDLRRRAFYPLTMPLTVGPGSISVALTLGANPPRGARQLIMTTAGHALGILIVAVIIYLCYRYASRILTKLGPIGSSVVLRLSAFILLCIGVQIAWNGLHDLVVSGFPQLAR